MQLLKHALNNLDENNAQFLEPDLQDALDLCVSCKGCKRECENNVDMALIKSEFLAQRNQVKKMSFRSKIFAKIPDLMNSSRWISSAVRLRNSSKLFALWADRLMGVSRKINLPEPVSSSDSPLEKLLSCYSIKTAEPIVAEVCLFVDTFCKNFEPNIVLDALTVLSQAGYKVSLVNAAKQENLCCGRTYLAQGMIKEAQAKAFALVETLYEKVNAGISVIGLEASCVLGLRDDALALFSDADSKQKIKTVAEKTFLLEEFIAREIKAKRFRLQGNNLAGDYFVHGHCHQKATGAMKSVRRVLKLLDQQTFTNIDSSCCGMAGTFGLESEHQELSEKMAQQSLIPVLDTNPEQWVVANGFSCRQQIKNYSRNKPVHLAEVLRRHLYS